ncbi:MULTISPECIES: DUF3153 domain-containing protein [unclassified Actinopolyspora]|uniref:DUF3153 domain-containing protein n=1 Tax=unclassified Actinopolyspora TaxID=2639451 RepID=UPI0013F5D8B3|nr:MULTISPECIES: DUF3153 domain-containing protein [unclassified Actinopolyspora]NHD17370.1 DUF3153 domain-containing protein [Actinopolyspora sp. BKK2]NHE76897.1 DUF3153 domain-containing protein [Actinopolyspora sp. BKK1]
MILLVGVLVSGCLNATVSLSIDEQDKVSGEVMIATPPAANRGDLRMRVPRELSDRVSVSPYREGERQGSKIEFDSLDFEELERLARELSSSDSRYSLSLSRSGTLVKLNGSVDLTPLAETNSDVLVEVSTPGEVTTTNGETDAGMVSWHPSPGEVTEMSATFQFSSNRSAGLFGWSTIVGLVTFGTAFLVAVLALLARQRYRKEAEQG